VEDQVALASEAIDSDLIDERPIGEDRKAHIREILGDLTNLGTQKGLAGGEKDDRFCRARRPQR
jgi:hypothetical protein